MTKAICYMRVSTDRQELSLQAQRSSCEEWADANNVEIVAFYEEKISGGAPLEQRRVLTEAIAAVGVNKASYLLAAKRDRLGRTVFVHAALHLLVTKANPDARVVTADGNGNGGSIEDELMSNILAAFSQYERGLIKLRIQAALEEKKKRGERLGGPPYGWKIDRGPEGMDPKQVKLLPLMECEIEQSVLAKMVQLRARGMSCEHVAKQMNTLGYRARRGKWHATSVQRALKRAGEFRDQRFRENRDDSVQQRGAGAVA